MASVTVGLGRVVISSGSRISVLENLNTDSVLTLQPFLHTSDTSDTARNGANNAENGTKHAQNGGKTSESIVSLGVSKCGEYLAVCGENKMLKVFHHNMLVCSTVLARKASKLVFTKEAEYVVIADKNGDIHKYLCKPSDPESDAHKPELVLGHLSMLLDVQLSPTNRYILTADRDEKIRVSHYPNGYNINNFCLGHTDFVTSISLLDEDLLVSGSGDGTVRVWKYLEARQMAVREVYKDVDVKLKRNAANIKEINEDLEDMEIERKRNEPSELPAVIKVKSLPGKSTFLVQVEGMTGLLLYSYQTSVVEKLQHVELGQEEDLLLDFDLDSSAGLTCLTRTKDGRTKIKQFIIDPEADRYVSDKEVVLAGSCVEVGEEVAGDLRILHKRWFDNMKDYLERKEMRLEKTRLKADTRLKAETGLKADTGLKANLPAKKQKLDS